MARSLDDIADRLYAMPPATFVSARDDEVSQARTDGDRDAAKAIGALRRPTVGAWLVNLLALRRGDELAELDDLGAKLRSAQSNLKGDQMRELATRRRKTVSRLVGMASDLAVAEGASRSGLPAADVETTLNAAVADADIARDVRSGRLVRTVQYDGFGEMPRPDLQLVPGGRTAPEKTAPKKTATSQPAAEPEPPRIDSAALARRRLAARKLHQAEVGLAAARNAFKSAEQALRSAEETEAQAREVFAAAERDLQE